MQTWSGTPVFNSADTVLMWIMSLAFSAARNSQAYQWLTQPDNQPWQQAAIVTNNAPGPYLSCSMILDDTDLSASTLLNLDLSMSELSGISQE